MTKVITRPFLNQLSSSRGHCTVATGTVVRILSDGFEEMDGMGMGVVVRVDVARAHEQPYPVETLKVLRRLTFWASSHDKGDYVNMHGK